MNPHHSHALMLRVPVVGWRALPPLSKSIQQIREDIARECRAAMDLVRHYFPRWL